MEPYTDGVTETPSTSPTPTSRLFSAAAAIGEVIDAARDVAGCDDTYRVDLPAPYQLAMERMRGARQDGSAAPCSRAIRATIA